MRIQKLSKFALAILLTSLIVQQPSIAGDPSLSKRLSLNEPALIEKILSRTQQKNYTSLFEPANGKQTKVINFYAPVVEISLSDTHISAELLKLIDLKYSVVRLSLSHPYPNASWDLDSALIFLVRQAANMPVIAGIEVDTAVPLSQSAAHMMTVLAKKAVFLSAKFQFANSRDWLSLFKAMQQNKQLLTTIYGPVATKQIQSKERINTILSGKEMSAAFANNGMLFSHFYTSSDLTQKQAASFWMSVAEKSKQTKQPNTILLLNANVKDSIDYKVLLNEVLPKSNGYLTFVGGDDVHQFVPVSAASKSLTVWRLVENKIKAFPCERVASPESLYLALGMGSPAFDTVKFFTERAKRALVNGIGLLSDAEDNFHTNMSLMNFANTVVMDGNELSMPPLKPELMLSKLNIVVNHPTRAVIRKMTENTKQLRSSVMDQHYVGVFDYSLVANKTFYRELAEVLSGASDVRYTFDTNNQANMDYFRQFVENALPKTMVSKMTIIPAIHPSQYQFSRIATISTRREDYASSAAWNKKSRRLEQASQRPGSTRADPIQVTLNVNEEKIRLNGEEVTAFNLVQPDGTQGLIANRGDYFNVTLRNRTKDPISLRWHWLDQPNQHTNRGRRIEIKPGQSFQYRFVLKKAGTYWIHSNDKQHELNLMAAPIVVYDPSDQSTNKNVTVMLQNYTSKNHTPIYLANRRTINNPQVVTVLPGQKVLLRIVNAAVGTSFDIDTGKLTAKTLAIQGVSAKLSAIKSIKLDQSQRKDIEITIPNQSGVYPVFARVQGSNSQAGIVFATPDVEVNAQNLSFNNRR